MIKLNITGRMTITPEINYKKRSKPEPYERKNNITQDGTIMRSVVKQRIKNLSHYLFKANFNNLKLFTFSLPTSKKKLGTMEVFQSDDYYTKKFSMLLENLKKNHGLKNYYWVSERQMKNGRGAIHYHAVFDIGYISAQRLSLYWARLVGQYHISNSTCVDYRPISNVKTLSCYLSKYLTKSDANQTKIYCRVWAASREWSKLSKSIYCVKEIQDPNDLLETIDLKSKSIFKIPHTEFSISNYYFDSDQVYHLYFKIFKGKKLKKRKEPAFEMV